VPSPPQLAHTSSHVLASRCGWLAADELAESTVIVAAAETEMDNGDRTCTRLGCCVAGGSPATGHAAGEARFVIPRPQQPDPCCAHATSRSMDGQRSTICGTAQASVRACVVSAAPCPCDRGTAYSKCSVVVVSSEAPIHPLHRPPTHHLTRWHCSSLTRSTLAECRTTGCPCQLSSCASFPSSYSTSC
jgi:hypothetical protein